MEKLFKEHPNVFSIVDSENGDRANLMTIKDITKFTAVYSHSSFEVGEGLIYFIPKYDKIFTDVQAAAFVNKHAKEKFIVVSDSSFSKDTTIFTYIISEINQLTLYCYNITGDGKNLTLFGKIQNEKGKSKWGQTKILDASCTGFYDEEYEGQRNRRYYSNDEVNLLCCSFANHSSRQKECQIINGSQAGNRMKFNNIIKDCLRISGKTRITRASSHYRNAFFSYETGRFPQYENESIAFRYGLPLSLLRRNGDGNVPYEWFSKYNYTYGDGYMMDFHDTMDNDAPKEDKERIFKRITAKLEAKAKGNSPYIMLKTDMLLISDPIPGHRRPSFHFYRGFRCNDITEIVELFRGELLIKDMLPEKVYVFTDEGTFNLASYDLKSEAIGLVQSKDVEIDAISFSRWAEERSLHPHLLTLMTSEYFDTIDLPTVKILNKVPFGSLLIEQLISSHHFNLALNLAAHITNSAYDFNNVCGKLEDIFPGCNGEETSLYKILNVSRGVAKWLFENEDNLSTFIDKYTATTFYGGNLVLTDEIKIKVENYLKMRDLCLHKFRLMWGDREFNFLYYPELMKPILRMYNKIEALRPTMPTYELMDVKNKYNEIVRAYCSFLDYSTTVPAEERERWLPERMMIFLEFSLTGTPDHPLNPHEEISSREKSANRALKIYEQKANEKLHADNEAKFSDRLRTISKLKSLASLDKDKDFKDYVVIPPTQIYGVDVEGSVEKEAFDLNHCLFRAYTERIIDGEYTALWLRPKKNINQSIITIGITSDGRIEQTRGLHDRDATPEEARAIAAWAISKQGMLTFKSEGADVRPGGWPYSVPVPDLPKPDKDWLKRLKGDVQ